MDGYMGNYDAWKTACCGLYPDCSNCPFDNDYEDEEEDDYEEDDE